MRNHFVSLLILLTALGPNLAGASKIQQQGIKTHADCIAAGATDATCLPLTAQIYDETNLQSLKDSIANGQLGGSGGGGNQLLVNPGFEIGTSHASWTVTTATAANETSTIYAGKNSTKLTYSSQTGGISQDVTPTANTASINMEASCKVLTTMSTIQVCGRNAGADLSNCTAVPANGTWNYVAYNFVGPSNGTSVGVDVKTSASGTGTVYVDDCYVGPARNIDQVSQAQFIGSISWTCSGNWNTSASSFSNFSATTGCTTTTTGSATAPGTFIPGITFPSLPAGDIMVVVSGGLFKTGSAGGSANFRISDGTTAFPGAIRFLNDTTSAIGGGGFTSRNAYTTAQGSTTLQIQAMGGTNITANIETTSNYPLQIAVYSFPTQSQTAVNAGSLASSQQTHQGVAGYGSTNTVILRYSTNAVNIGSDITYNPSSTLGDSWTINSSGQYCMTGELRENAGGNEWDIARNITGPVTLDPASSGYNATGNNGYIAKVGTVGSSPTTIAWCGYLAQGDVISTAIKAGLTFSTTRFAIAKVNNTMAAPMLVGSVTSNSAGAERIERLKVASACSSTPCTISSQSSAWATVTRASGPIYTVNFTAGVFSATPTCNVLMGNGANGLIFNPMNPPANTTSFNFTTTNTSGTGFDAGFDVICMGPR